MLLPTTGPLDRSYRSERAIQLKQGGRFGRRPEKNGKAATGIEERHTYCCKHGTRNDRRNDGRSCSTRGRRCNPRLLGRLASQDNERCHSARSPDRMAIVASWSGVGPATLRT
jgi:hypothetical protein